MSKRPVPALEKSAGRRSTTSEGLCQGEERVRGDGDHGRSCRRRSRPAPAEPRPGPSGRRRGRRLRFDEAIERVTVSPGAALYLSGGFTNGTDRTLDAVYLQVDLDRQFTLPDAFRNCWYSAADTEVRVNRMVCRLEGAVRPGRSYDLYLGTARIAGEAGNGRISYRVSAERGDVPISPAARRGSDVETLAFTERDSAEGVCGRHRPIRAAR